MIGKTVIYILYVSVISVVIKSTVKHKIIKKLRKNKGRLLLQFTVFECHFNLLFFYLVSTICCHATYKYHEQGYSSGYADICRKKTKRNKAK